MILHAGGVTPEGVTGSNSLEALEHSYENGFRLLELDFSWTCDGELVLRPRLERFLWPHPGHGLPHPGPVRGRPGQHLRLHFPDPGSSDRLAEGTPRRLHRHRYQGGLRGGAALIAQRCPDLRSRFIIQIYHPEEYDQVADLGFEHIILTVYQMSWSEKQDTAALVRFAAEHPLEGITFPVELADTPGYVEALLEAQVPLFVHTVNDPADQAALVRQGISGIYTDLGAPAPQE